MTWLKWAGFRIPRTTQVERWSAILTKQLVSCHSNVTRIKHRKNCCESCPNSTHVGSITPTILETWYLITATSVPFHRINIVDPLQHATILKLCQRWNEICENNEHWIPWKNTQEKVPSLDTAVWTRNEMCRDFFVKTNLTYFWPNDSFN